jgi:hypothetical protein
VKLQISEQKEAYGDQEPKEDQPAGSAEQDAVDSQQQKSGADRYVPPSEQRGTNGPGGFIIAHGVSHMHRIRGGQTPFEPANDDVLVSFSCQPFRKSAQMAAYPTRHCTPVIALPAC